MLVLSGQASESTYVKQPKPAPKPYRPGHKGRPPKSKQGQRALAHYKLDKAKAQIEEAQKALKESEESA